MTPNPPDHMRLIASAANVEGDDTARIEAARTMAAILWRFEWRAPVLATTFQQLANVAADLTGLSRATCMLALGRIRAARLVVFTGKHAVIVPPNEGGDRVDPEAYALGRKTAKAVVAATDLAGIRAAIATRGGGEQGQPVAA